MRPVGQLVNHGDEPWHDRIQPIRLHLYPHKAKERIARGQNPPVHDVT